MVNFAELKAKAEKAKDAGVTKATNTRDWYSSVPSSRANWDPNWKRARAPRGSATSSSVSATAAASTSHGGLPPPPPPPLPSRSRPDVIAPGAPEPPMVPRAETDSDDTTPAPPVYTPRPPPTRGSGYPPSRLRETSQPQSQDAVDGDRDWIGWTNLSAEDKETFFVWLDEFFSRYLGVGLGPRARASSASAMATPPVQVTRAPPIVKRETRPRA